MEETELTAVTAGVVVVDAVIVVLFSSLLFCSLWRLMITSVSSPLTPLKSPLKSTSKSTWPSLLFFDGLNSSRERRFRSAAFCACLLLFYWKEDLRRWSCNSCNCFLPSLSRYLILSSLSCWVSQTQEIKRVAESCVYTITDHTVMQIACQRQAVNIMDNFHHRWCCRCRFSVWFHDPFDVTENLFPRISRLDALLQLIGHFLPLFVSWQ